MKHRNIPIFVPHLGCPFDCVFCNQRHITGEEKSVTADDVRRIIKEHLSDKRSGEYYTEAAFFGGSFTGIPLDIQNELLSAAYEFVKSGDIAGIRLSTRPDYINDSILSNLDAYGVKTIELGVQSLDDEVLKLSGRGHNAECVKEAVELIRKYPFKLGLQMMTGLPGDTPEKSLETAEKIILLKPDFVRIYPTLVIKDTRLFEMYESGEYSPQPLYDSVRLVKELLIRFSENNIDVIRIALQTTAEISPDALLAAGPFHEAFGELVQSELFFDKMNSMTDGDFNVFRVNPSDVSKAVGHKGMNLKRFEDKGIRIKILSDKSVSKGEIDRGDSNCI